MNKQILIFILGAIFLNSCIENSTKQYAHIEGAIQGTTYSIIYNSSDLKNYQDEIEAILHDFDMSLSIYKEQSLVSQINRNETDSLDNYLMVALEKSLQIYKNTHGAFDITVGPIVNLIGFGKDSTARYDSAMIDSLKAYVGSDKISIENHKIKKQLPQITLDFNAIAQGYSVDVIADFFDQKGVENYLIEIGGEIRAKGVNDKGNIWRIGIDKPIEDDIFHERDLQAIIKLENRSLATSGNYRKFYMENGVKVVHTIDPRIGYPVSSNLLSATIISKKCIDADAYATACMVVGLDKSIEMINQNNALDGYLIYSDSTGNYGIWKSQLFDSILIPVDTLF